MTHEHTLSCCRASLTGRSVSALVSKQSRRLFSFIFSLTGRPASVDQATVLRALALGIGLPGLVLGAVVLSRLPSSAETTARVAPATPAMVTIADVEPAPATREHRYYGVVRASERSTLSFAQGGRIATRSVAIGDRVTAGQPIAALETEQLGHALAAAQAQVDEARAQLDQLGRDAGRAEQLAAADAVPAQQLEQIHTRERTVQAKLDAANVQVDEARRAQREATLRAPFDGTVREVLVQPGEMVGPGTPVVLLAGGGALEVEVEVSEAVVGDITVDTPAAIHLPLVGIRDLEGRVVGVGRCAGGPGRLFPVLIEVESNGDVLPGMSASVALSLAAVPALSVPVAAVVAPTGNRTSVFTVRDQRITRVDVEVVELLGERVAIDGALAVGDAIVTGGIGGLVDGQRVEVRR